MRAAFTAAIISIAITVPTTIAASHFIITNAHTQISPKALHEIEPSVEKGARGVPGKEGIQGKLGEQGLQGLEGKQGEKGENGKNSERIGPTGPMGPKGESGTVGIVNAFFGGQWNKSSEYPAGVIVLYHNTDWFSNFNKNTGNEPGTSNAWIEFLKGITGPTGATG